MQQNDSIVIIPTYNEKENIEAIIRAVTGLQEHAFDIFDHRRRQSRRHGRHRERIDGRRVQRPRFLVERQGKLGLGTAYIAGFKWALEHHYEYVFEMDADSVTTRKTCRASTRLAPKKATTWRSAAAMCRASMW